jgi:putative chitinase
MQIARRHFLISGTALLPLSQAAAVSAAENCGVVTERSEDLVTSIKISKFSPRARADLVATLVNKWPDAFAAGVNTPVRTQHFMVQMATETGGFVRLDENLNYSAKRLRQIFPKRVSTAKALELANRPEAIANHVYNRPDLGNTELGDGWKYRGSGYIQLTGKSNFRKRGERLGLDFVGNPEQVRQPITGFDAALAYWKTVGGNMLADAGNMNKVRRAVNGGLHGIKEANLWMIRARKFFTAAPSQISEAGGPDGAEIAAAQALLNDFVQAETSVPTEAGDPGRFIESLQEFRKAAELPTVNTEGMPVPLKVKLLYDEDMLYALTDPVFLVPPDPE